MFALLQPVEPYSKFRLERQRELEWPQAMSSVAPSGEQKIQRKTSNRIQPVSTEVAQPRKEAKISTAAEGRTGGDVDNRRELSGGASAYESGPTRVASPVHAVYENENKKTAVLNSKAAMAEEIVPTSGLHTGAAAGAAAAAAKRELQREVPKHAVGGHSLETFSGVEHLGVDLDFFEGLSKTEGISESTLTKNLVGKSLFRTAEEFGISPVDYLKRDANNKPHIGKATHYVIHAWKMPFMHLVQTLSDFVAARQEGDPKW